MNFGKFILDRILYLNNTEVESSLINTVHFTLNLIRITFKSLLKDRNGNRVKKFTS